MTDYDLHTGIGILDSQHQTFLTILEKIKNCDRTDSEKLATLIDELHLYTLYHFETEEKLLKESKVENFEAHQKKHNLLTEKIEEYRLENLTDSCLLAQGMCDFLEKWLFEHILETDMVDLAKVKAGENH
ncbi:hemerythrin domain-containing protein [Maridesulfovibrio sp.]|uniref:bacteriohemerythrin n=1 Tax=Maridesulfovibrio sp. TaxID=2795000 RepID=UPI002A18828C|nr:hemerythrin domain-containing protein [Maridesulfovibrio sp.]